MGFVDHGPGGTGEPVTALLRPGNAGSNTAADHITAAQLALSPLPKEYRRGRRTLIRTDSAGGTHDFVAWLARRGRWLSCSVGMAITEAIHSHVLKVPTSAWSPAVEADGDPGPAQASSSDLPEHPDYPHPHRFQRCGTSRSARSLVRSMSRALASSDRCTQRSASARLLPYRM